jgi:hypothetical protein
LCGPLYGVLVGAMATSMGGDLPTTLPLLERARAAADALRVVVAGASCAAVAAYVVVSVRAARRGAPVPWLKHALLVSTGVACVVAWGTNPLGQGLLIVNVFHAVQYFGLVAYTERAQLAARFGFVRRPAVQVFVLLVVVGLGYGFWFGAAPDLWLTNPALSRVVLAVVNTVALLHFWYDGFIWSVRRGDVSAS